MRQQFFILGLFAVCACGSSAATSDGQDVTGSDPLAMPPDIRNFLAANNWGTHHLGWHTARQWDRIQARANSKDPQLAQDGQQSLDYAKKQGWQRANNQEGAPKNGIEFLAMHHTMIQILTDRFPNEADLFQGWETPPTDPKNPNDPVTGDADGVPNMTGDFNPSFASAIDKIQNHLEDFQSDDEFGLYVETSFRPTKDNPSAKCSDKSAGLHNYLHVRFSDSKSEIDIGDPSVNLNNRRFWRLHGWLESRWMAFRQIKKMDDNDAVYQDAIQQAQQMLPTESSSMPRGAMMVEPPPDSLRKFFARNSGASSD